MVDGVVVYGRNGAIARMNAAAEECLEYTDEQLRLPVEERLRALKPRTAEAMPLDPENTPPLRALRGETVSGELLQVQVRSGRPRWLIMSAAPIQAAGEERQGAVITFADVTRLHDLQEQREDFIRMVSHDLRNPLTVVLGQASLLQDSLTRRKLYHDAAGAEIVAKCARRMNSMIQDLVESVRLESGQLEPRPIPVDLHELALDLAGRVGTAEDQARLKVEREGDVPPVFVDPQCLERAMTNLLTNALKYSPPDAPVLVRIERQSGRGVVSVTDRGVGIPPDELPSVFERFYRASTRAKADGLGLGLYITRLLVEASGGKVGVASVVGEGTTFTISLPLAETGTTSPH
jgi:signal transduction histidine kinase